MTQALLCRLILANISRGQVLQHHYGRVPFLAISSRPDLATHVSGQLVQMVTSPPSARSWSASPNTVANMASILHEIFGMPLGRCSCHLWSRLSRRGPRVVHTAGRSWPH